jgi:hypothetical protein
LKSIKHSSLLVLTTATILAVLSFNWRSSNTTSLTLQFNHYVNNDLLVLDSVTYHNALHQPFTVTKFKYYISNITLINKQGKRHVIKQSFLIDEENATSKQLVLKNIPIANYNAIEFLLGVDSLHNCSGAQSGALDPTNGMFWAWNTGYIFLKLEGQSSASSLPKNLFEYHIGGYMQPTNCIQKITIALPETIVGLKKPSSLAIKVDAAELLKNPTDIDFSKLPSVTDFNNAKIIATNYADMFSVISLQHAN